jgi:hypothetical protein
MQFGRRQLLLFFDQVELSLVICDDIVQILLRNFVMVNSLIQSWGSQVLVL